MDRKIGFLAWIGVKGIPGPKTRLLIPNEELDINIPRFHQQREIATDLPDQQTIEMRLNRDNSVLVVSIRAYSI